MKSRLCLWLWGKYLMFRESNRRPAFPGYSASDERPNSKDAGPTTETRACRPRSFEPRGSSSGGSLVDEPLLNQHLDPSK